MKLIMQQLKRLEKKVTRIINNPSLLQKGNVDYSKKLNIIFSPYLGFAHFVQHRTSCGVQIVTGHQSDHICWTPSLPKPVAHVQEPEIQNRYTLQTIRPITVIIHITRIDHQQDFKKFRFKISKQPCRPRRNEGQPCLLEGVRPGVQSRSFCQCYRGLPGHFSEGWCFKSIAHPALTTRSTSSACSSWERTEPAPVPREGLDRRRRLVAGLFFGPGGQQPTKQRLGLPALFLGVVQTIVWREFQMHGDAVAQNRKS